MVKNSTLQVAGTELWGQLTQFLSVLIAWDQNQNMLWIITALESGHKPVDIKKCCEVLIAN
jgi:NO-binding membrane sensor protein with MHYT domain